MWHGLGLAVEVIFVSFLLSLWIWSLLHCAANHTKGVERTPWILLLLFLPLLGCPVYFLLHGRKK